MSDKRKTALYIRVARKDDEAAGRQEDMLRGYAEARGCRNVLAYVDNGVSGIGYDRPALGRLNTDILTGHIKTVIVKDLSRLSRSPYEVPDWLDGIRRCGVSFISVQDRISDDAFDKKDVLFQRYCEYVERQENQAP